MVLVSMLNGKGMVVAEKYVMLFVNVYQERKRRQKQMTQYSNQPGNQFQGQQGQPYTNQPYAAQNAPGFSSQGSQGSAVTGVSDPHYDLVSIAYHALNGAQIYETYIQDAVQHGDNELAQFLRQVQQEDRRRAQQAMYLLSQRVMSRSSQQPQQQQGSMR